MKKRKATYDPLGDKPFKLSRSKIELYHECPCCFYLDCKMGITRPSGPPFSLNTAVDELLKKEFDVHRQNKTAHPLMLEHGIDAIPFQHEKLDEWRFNFKGITFLHEPTGFLVTGAIDDLWINTSTELIVVDYKATSKREEVTIDADWQQSYKRQMEIYQWLFRKNGFPVSKTGFFIYCNGKKDRPSFDGKLEFGISVIPYQGEDSWIDSALENIHKCLSRGTMPEPATTCKVCLYRLSIQELLCHRGDSVALPNQ